MIPIILFYIFLIALVFFSRSRYPIFHKKPTTEQQTKIQSSSKFYTSLNPRNRKLFEHRVLKFLALHSFIGNSGLQVTETMKIEVACTAITLSFGFTNYLYDLFDKILIYPTDYYSEMSRQQHKGETNPKFGVIVFSWEDFKAGIVIEDDNLNLGLHEFAHALHFSFKYKETKEGAIFLNDFKNLLEYLKDPSIQKKMLQSGYLREYAFENQYEFFAVLVEHFYETPRLFNEKLPVIFRMIQKTLKLNSYQLN